MCTVRHSFCVGGVDRRVLYSNTLCVCNGDTIKIMERAHLEYLIRYHRFQGNKAKVSDYEEKLKEFLQNEKNGTSNAPTNFSKTKNTPDRNDVGLITQNKSYQTEHKKNKPTENKSLPRDTLTNIKDNVQEQKDALSVLAKEISLQSKQTKTTKIPESTTQEIQYDGSLQEQIEALRSFKRPNKKLNSTSSTTFLTLRSKTTAASPFTTWRRSLVTGWNRQRPWSKTSFSTRFSRCS